MCILKNIALQNFVCWIGTFEENLVVKEEELAVSEILLPNVGSSGWHIWQFNQCTEMKKQKFWT